MSSQRPSDWQAPPHPRVPVLEKTRPSVDMLKFRLLLMLNDQYDGDKLHRMPASLVRETARRQLRQTLDSETPRLAPGDRERFIEELLGDAFGFGPLEELFNDPGVTEIAVLGPYSIVARRAQGWVPTPVKFRDAEHVEDVIEKIRAQGEAIGGPLPESMVDVKLNNGFRAVAVVPVSSIGLSPTAAFVRVEVGTPVAVPASAPVEARPAPPASPPVPQSAQDAIDHSLEPHRRRIIQRIMSKLGSLGTRNLSRLAVSDLSRVVAAYVSEYCATEQVRLSEKGQARLIHQVLATFNR